jgi:hypothetical protein
MHPLLPLEYSRAVQADRTRTACNWRLFRSRSR